MNNKAIIEIIRLSYDMKNYADLGGCYPSKPKAEADNTLLDLHNSSYHTQPHPIIAKYQQLWILNIFMAANELCLFLLFSVYYLHVTLN